MKTVFKTIRRLFFPGVLALVALLAVAHYSWKYSGSNEWELVREENGVRIYTLKAPGATLLKVRSEARVKTSMSSAVFLLRGDEATNDDFGGKDFKIFERIETPDLYHAYMSVKHVMPPPFATKELVVLLNYAQDKKTKEVVVHVQAAPTKIPPSADAERVTHLNNLFRVTPLPNGEVIWEITMDVDMGLIYPLANLSLPEYLYQDLVKHRKLLTTDKYRNAKLLSVQEL